VREYGNFLEREKERKRGREAEIQLGLGLWDLLHRVVEA
jgi:hypothetical protein